jgi:hypothetical protein
MAIVIQQQAGQRQGVANYVLYSLAKTAANVCNSSTATLPNSCVFYDVTKGNNSVACTGGSPNCSSMTMGQVGILTLFGGPTPAYNATTGYDLATGLGSVNVANLLAKWASPIRTPTTTTLNLSNTTFPVGVSITVSGTVSSNTAAGLVVLENAATRAVIPASNGQSGSVSGGNFNFTTAFMPAGSYSVIAHYGGDGTFASSDSAPVAVNIAQGPSKTVLNFVSFVGTAPQLSTATQTVTYGSPYILRVDVENAGSNPCENLPGTTAAFACPTGTVKLTDKGVPLLDFFNAQNANASNIANLNDRGFAEDQQIQLPVGVHSLAAAYSGDISYVASNSNTLSITVTQASTSIVVTPSPTSITSGGSVTLTAVVSTPSNGEPPCGSGVSNPGTVQFRNGSTAISGTVSYSGTSGAASASGKASCTATLTTSLSQLVPLNRPQPRLRMPTIPLWVVAVLAILLLTLAQHAARLQRKWPRLGNRLGYAAAGLLLFACLAASFAGCSGSKSSSGGGGGSRTDSITAVYSGDANYAGSTATAVSVTIQ